MSDLYATGSLRYIQPTIRDHSVDGFVASSVIRGLYHSLTPPVQQPYHSVSNWAESIASNLASGTKSIGASDLQIHCLRRNLSRLQIICCMSMIWFSFIVYCVRYWCLSTLDVFHTVWLLAWCRRCNILISANIDRNLSTNKTHAVEDLQLLRYIIFSSPKRRQNYGLVLWHEIISCAADKTVNRATTNHTIQTLWKDGWVCCLYIALLFGCCCCYCGRSIDSSKVVEVVLCFLLALSKWAGAWVHFSFLATPRT